MFIKKGTKTGICFLAIIEHYNYNYYYYTFIASVVLVFVVEIIFFYQTPVTLEQNSLKNIAGHFFFRLFHVFQIFGENPYINSNRKKFIPKSLVDV